MSKLTDPTALRELLSRHGFHFSRALGQNFLIDASVPARIAESVGADADCGVLEIGPGVGCLTEELSLRAGKVLSVEADERLRPLLRETLAGRENVEILFSDVMKLDIRSVADEKLPQRTKLVCANLPYQITTPVLTALIRADCFARICVMIQKEVAERICAGPGTKAYGAFSLLVQYFCKPELLFTVSPHCFMPQPGVTSAVVLLTRREEPPAEVSDEELFFSLIRAAFNQRRKTLPNALNAAFPEIGKENWEKILELSGNDTKIRGEALNLSQFARISNEYTAFQRNNL